MDIATMALTELAETATSRSYLSAKALPIEELQVGIYNERGLSGAVASLSPSSANVIQRTDTFAAESENRAMTQGKTRTIDQAMSKVQPGTRLMIGEFVGAGEPTACIDWLLGSGIGDLTLIANTPGMRGGFGKARLFASGQIREYIGTHVGTTDESTDAYLGGHVMVREFFPMGTWAEKVRAGGVGLGGVLVPVGVGILDEPDIFPELEVPKRKMELGGLEYFVEPALTADVSIIKGWRADLLGNVEFRGTSAQNQRDIAMAGDHTIVEVNEIVEVGAIPPDRVGCPGVFVDVVVQGETLEAQHDAYRRHWLKLGRLPKN